MSDASKTVPPQPQQTDLSGNRPPVLRLCAIFAVAMATVHAVQHYDARQQLKNKEASASDACLQDQWQPAAAQNGEQPVITDAKADAPVPINDHTPKTCPEFTPPVS